MYESYSNTSEYNKMSQDQLKKWESQEKKIGLPGSGLFALSWTMTQGPMDSSIETVAKKANQNLAGFLATNSNKKMPNIVSLCRIQSASATPPH